MALHLAFANTEKNELPSRGLIDKWRLRRIGASVAELPYSYFITPTLIGSVARSHVFFELEESSPLEGAGVVSVTKINIERTIGKPEVIVGLIASRSLRDDTETLYGVEAAPEKFALTEADNTMPLSDVLSAVRYAARLVRVQQRASTLDS